MSFNLGSILPRSLKFWPATLIATVSLAWFAYTLYFTNQFGVYSLSHWAYALPFAGLMFIVASTWNGIFFSTKISQLSASVKTALVLCALSAAALLYALFPPPTPALSQSHQLQITPIRAERELPEAAANDGAAVEITRLAFANGQKIPLEKVKITGAWQTSGSALLSFSQAGDSLELSGPMPASMVISLKYSPEGGVVRVVWDGQPLDYDLFSPAASTSNLLLPGLDWKLLPAPQAAVYFLCMGLYFCALLSIALFTVLILRFGFIKPHCLVLLFLSLACFAAFWNLKASYTIFASERVYRDSQSYFRTAAFPLNSAGFWAGERPFTLPLVYKLLSTSGPSPAMPSVSRVQMALSIFSWTIFAAAIARMIRQRWLKPFTFGLLLFFSLNMEVALWDQLLLSESISNSLFVLLLACWITWFSFSEKTARAVQGISFLLFTGGITILYSFTRDSNVYFLLISAAIFILAVIFKKIPPHLRLQCSGYAAFILLLYLAQSFSLSAGNRWQIFIYDHLAMRLLNDPQALAFFSQEGLPVSAKLLSTTTVINVRYQEIFMYDRDLEPVRQWVTQHGKTAYFKYLLSRPLNSLFEPLQNAGQLLNTTIADYQYPRFLPLAIPDSIGEISAIFYSFHPAVLAIFLLMILVGSCVFWFARQHSLKSRPAWLVLSILFVSLYPLMFVTWHGDPMEIPRHALQIGVQLRLAGWSALLLLLDTCFGSVWFRARLGLEQPEPY